MPKPASQSQPQSPPDRRHRRRQQTIEEILDTAAAVMGEEGAGGLSLGEVARRIGVRTPSLYVYFDSKNALYDALFERGWRAARDVVAPCREQLGTSDNPAAVALGAAQAFARWALSNPAYAQLMFWRPVPGFEPSAQAYAPAIEVAQGVAEMFAVLRDRGVVRPDVDLADVVAGWTSLVSGVISQQLSNAPHESFENGSFTRLLPQLVSMFLAYYGEGRKHDGASTSRPRARVGGDATGRRRNLGDGAAQRAARPVAKPRSG